MCILFAAHPEGLITIMYIMRGENQKGVSDILGEIVIYIYIYTYIYTVPCESIHTPSFFSRFVMLLPYVKLL